MANNDTQLDETDNNIEPYLMTILSKKFEMASRDMTQSLLKSARSGVINVARDFSSAITLYDGRQFMMDEGLPVHSANIHFTPQYTLGKFDEIKPGDCFLTNSPYAGNTHHADYTLHVPVFYNDEPLFWAINRAHQADCGAPVPSTYLADAKNIYEEGPHLPSVRIQQEYENNEDIVRMLKLNIRLGETQWQGDYLAQLSAVRTGEEAIQDLCDEYGVETIKTFAEEWIDYGERMMRKEVRKLPADTIERTAYHDPVQFNDAAPEGVRIHVKLSIEPDEEMIYVDLTDNSENLPFGFNLSKATTVAGVYGGIFNNLDSDMPHNQGSINRIKIEMDQGKVVGDPKYPVGTATATTNVFNTLFNAVQASFGQLGEPYGMAEGHHGMPPGWGVISGSDFRRNGGDFVNQIFHNAGGGPAVHGHDGWLTYGVPGTGGVLQRDSIEIEEQLFPILVERHHLVDDSEGAGTWIGAPGSISAYRPREDPITIAYFGTCAEFPPKGILDGQAGGAVEIYKCQEDEEQVDLPTIGVEEITPEETVVSTTAGGGGYGPPSERDPEAVRNDVQAGLVSTERARDIYGVAVHWMGNEAKLDEKRSSKLRQAMEKD
jgi:N-methylhydantoinase B